MSTTNTSRKGLTTEQCKSILFKVGIKFGISPAIISTRLLDAQDKCDMLNGEVPVEMLEVAVKAWQDAGMPDYETGHTKPMGIKKGFQNHQTPEKVEQPSDGLLPLNAPFVRHSDPNPAS